MSNKTTPQFNLKGKVVIITGGSGGIEFACAESLLSQCANVSIEDVFEKASRNAESKLIETNLAGQAMFQVVDVRKVVQLDDWIAKTVSRFGKFDGADSNASISSELKI